LKDFFLDESLIGMIELLFEVDDLNILFISDPNSGKTTLLYALIREYYNLKKYDPIPENNIMFINNLKEQGINYFRNEMKTFCQSHSSIHGKKKIIIIDDIDTINEQSQQVFRNYIDKYKHNVHFISVCVNIQKVIESFQSRVHILNVPPPNQSHFKKIMDRILIEEKIVIDEKSKNYLLMISNNSIRNLINNLEKIYIYGEPIDYDLCRKICSNISFQQFEKYIESLRKKDLATAINIMYDIHDHGYSVIDILDYFFTFVKLTEFLNEDEKYAVIPFLCKYITTFHNIHEDVIEMSLFTNDLFRIIN
jgi:DNA polymerase III delta prime subunit